MAEISGSGLGLNVQIVDELKKRKEEIKQFDSLEKAMEHANKHVGDESVIQTKDDTGKDVYLVVNLKSGTKASDIFDPESSLKFPTAYIVRDNKKIEVVKTNEDISEASLTKATADLTEIAMSDKATGFKWSETGNIQGAAVYQNNIKVALVKINTLEKTLTEKKEKLEAELKACETPQKVLIPMHIGAERDKDFEEVIVQPNPERIKAKKQEIAMLDSKLQELDTQKGILNIKLTVQPVSTEKIPDTDLKIGVFRSTPAQAIIALRTRVAVLEDQLKTETNPEKIKSLKDQIGKLNSEVEFISKATGEINVAAVKTNLRVGSLASMNNSLDKAQNDIEVKLQLLKNLEQSLKDNPAETLRTNPQIETRIKQLKAEINQIRVELVSNLNTDLKTFEKNIPTKNNDAAIKAVELLKEQIKLLEGLTGNESQQILDAVKDTHKKLLGEVIEGAKQFKGIEPKEAEMIGQIVTKTHDFVSTYKATQTLVKNLIVDVEKAKSLPIFLYSAGTNPLLTAAQAWTAGTMGLTGVEANKTINDTYHHLNQEFNNYLGNPPISNWMTYGKFASREAGSQIRSLEGALEAIKTLTTFDGAIGNDTRAINALADVMEQNKMVEQGIRMGAASMGIPGAASMKGKDLILAIVAELDKAASPYLPAFPEKAAGVAIAKLAPVLTNLETLHGALVKGNTRIYENIVPAFDIFMQAEAAGGDGIKALAAAGYGKPNKTPMETYVSSANKDPQGFVLDAFKLYKEAKNIADKIIIKEQNGAPKEEIDKLKKQREDITHKANLLIGCQEQMAILQAGDIFNDPVVSSLLGAMTGTMSLEDTVGESALLPTKGGNHASTENWADFQTRMGLDEVKKGTAGAIAVQDSAGKIHYFVPIDKPASGTDKGEGTISRYFKERLTGTDSKTIIDGAPRDIQPIFRDNVEGQATSEDYSPIPKDSVDLIPKVVRILPKAYEQIF